MGLKTAAAVTSAPKQANAPKDPLCYPRRRVLLSGAAAFSFLFALRARVFPLSGAVLVVDKVDTTVGFNPFFPAVRQGS